jgi:chemotaxis protein methyltransferase CheR
VLIYFDKPLQDRVHRLFFGSLRRFGILGLGGREGLHGTVHQDDYEPMDDREPLFRRKA